MSDKRKPPQCTCGDRGLCGFCPSIGITAAREAHPYNHPAWRGRHPLNPGKPDDDQRRKRRAA